MKYNTWFWTECDELNKDTDFAHRLAEKAWNHQQEKIDSIENKLIEINKRLENIKNDEIRPRHNEYDLGWRDCASTILSDLQELLK